MTTSIIKALASGLALAACGTNMAMATPFAFNHPDMVLAVQATGGTGASQNVIVNLGNTTSFLNGGNRGTLNNIATVLSNTYGSDWFDRDDLWFGVVGNRDHLNPLFAPAPGAGEEATRTWYVSRSTNAPGSSVQWPAITGNSLGQGGTAFASFKAILLNPTAGEQLQEVASGVTILDQNAQPVAWNNSWTKWNPTPGAGFQIWAGGVQNNFGKAGDRSSVDVQRMVASTAGEYVVTISITSSGDIIASDGGTPPPVDTVPPVITLIGANPINLVVGASFTDPGANVTDNVDAPRVISGSGAVNTSIAGTYTLTYSTSDAAGNAATPVTRTVIVSELADTVPPVITLIGANPINLVVGDSFTDPGANVTDNVDAPRTITGTGTVNTAVAGTYTITYSTSDVAGNAATPVTRTVIVSEPVDSTPPVITLIGDNPINLLIGASFTDPGATVTDNVDAPRTITGSGTVNTSAVGTYTLTYTASDAAGNAATPVNRTVIVSAPLPTIPESVTFTTSVGGRFDLTNFFNEGDFADATVVPEGRLPAGLRYNAATKTLTGYPSRVPAQANFTVTLPGQGPQTFVIDFAFVPLDPGLIGTHVVQTADGDNLTLIVTNRGAATAQIIPAGQTRAISARTTVSFDADATNPSEVWTFSIPAQNLEIAFPVVRTLNADEGSFLGNYGQFNGKTLWGFKATDSIGQITLSRGATQITISAVVGARGAVAWTITPISDARPRAVRARGFASADGIASLNANLPGIGSIVGMLRVDEQVDQDGNPTGQLIMTILQGFDGWTPVEYVAP